MRKTIIVCDFCSNRDARRETIDLCDTCSSQGEFELHDMPFSTWPEMVSKGSVKRLLERRDASVAEQATEIRRERGKRERVEKELADVRKKAAEGIDNPTRTLTDITSGARR